MSVRAKRILIVDDEPALRQMLQITFSRQRFEVVLVPGVRAAQEAIQHAPTPVPVVLTDLMMPDGSGLDVLAAAKARSPATEVVVMTAHSSLDVAVDAMRKGAYDFVAKPFVPSEIVALVDKAIEKSSLIEENTRLRALVGQAPEGDSMLGRSGPMRRVADSASLLPSQFEALARIGQLLARSLDAPQSLREVLRTLEISGHLSRGMIAVVDPDSRDLSVYAVHGLDHDDFQAVCYRAGEGLLGRILESGRPCAVARLGEDPRFLNRLGLYERDLPFIAVPIHFSGTLQGVLAVQPDAQDDGLLDKRVRFVELLANLVGQSVRLSLEAAQERRSLDQERDPLRRTVPHRPGFGNLVGH